MRRAGGLVSVVLAVSLMVACGAGEDSTGQVDSAATAEAEMVAWCDDVELAGPVRDAPRGLPMNPDPVQMGVLQTYGHEHPDTYGGVWIDRASGGTVVIAFTDDPEPHRAALSARSPSPNDEAMIQPRPSVDGAPTLGESGFAFDVVQVAHTEAELGVVQQDVVAQMDAINADLDPNHRVFAVGSDPQRGRVSISMGIVDDTLRADLATRLPVDAVCIEGIDAATVTTLDPSTPTTLLPPEGSDPIVECMDMTFPLSAFDQPAGFETTDDPLAVDFREALAANPPVFGEFFGERHGWMLLARDDERALLGTEDGSWAVAMERTEKRWVYASSGGCGTRVALPGDLVPVSFIVQPHASTDTEIRLLVSESGCTGGQSVGDRLVGPEVRETEDEVLVALAARPLDIGPHTCPGNPPTEVTITLDAPIGDRPIFDGTNPPLP